MHWIQLRLDVIPIHRKTGPYKNEPVMVPLSQDKRAITPFLSTTPTGCFHKSSDSTHSSSQASQKTIACKGIVCHVALCLDCGPVCKQLQLLLVEIRQSNTLKDVPDKRGGRWWQGSAK